MKTNLTKDCVRRIRKMLAAVNKEQGRTLNQDAFPDCNDEMCRTTFCAAGHAVLANNPKRFHSLMRSTRAPYWRDEAIAALKLPPGTQTSTLFNAASDWPGQLGYAYEEADSDKDRLRAFNIRWEVFIVSDGLV